MRVSLGFEPAWYHRRCGVDLGERWHKDPRYRHDALVAMKAELHRAFPMVSYWNPDDPRDTWTMSGVYGAYVIPQVFGCTLQYAADRWPVIVHRPARSLEEWAALDPDELLAGAVRGRAVRPDGRHRGREAGVIHGYLVWHSVINNAFNIVGPDIFLALTDAPETAHRFFALICDVMIRLAQRVQARQRRSGFPINQMDISNCVMNMISPRAYRQFFFPYDRRCAESFERFGVHTCNWNVTPYVHELVKLPKVGYLDMGIMSDMRLVRAAFPRNAARGHVLARQVPRRADRGDPCGHAAHLRRTGPVRCGDGGHPGADARFSGDRAPGNLSHVGNAGQRTRSARVTSCFRHTVDGNFSAD